MILAIKSNNKKENNNCTLDSGIQRYLSEVHCGSLYSISNPNNAYEYLLKVFSGIYNLAFPLKTISVKSKTLQNPWMTKHLLKLSKQKQALCEKFMKKRSRSIYEGYKSLFESLKKKSKKIIIQDVLKTIKMI